MVNCDISFSNCTHEYVTSIFIGEDKHIIFPIDSKKYRIECDNDTLCIQIDITKPDCNGNVIRNPIKIITAVLVTSFVSLNASTMLTYEYDYHSEIVLSIDNNASHPNVMISCKENEEAIIVDGTVENADIISKKDEKRINKSHLLEQCNELKRYNFWLMLLFSIPWVTLVIIGIARMMVTTVIFSTVILLIVIAVFLYNNIHLNKIIRKNT